VRSRAPTGLFLGVPTTALAMLAVASAACDLPPPPAAREPLQGRVVSPTDGRLERDGVVQISVSALIEPRSMLGADASLRSGERELGVGLAFDPVTRLLVADPTARLLDPDIDYRLHLEGPRGFDGAPLAPTEDDVLAVLEGCRGCHEGPTAALGLDVTDLRRTAIGVPAAEVAGASFGRGLGGLQRIEAGHPERSYLVYKMLGEGPIVGATMGAEGSPDVPLPRASIAIVSRWIAAGARPTAREQP
jgi:hypothetical protein